MEVEGCARRRNQSDSKPEGLHPLEVVTWEEGENKWASLRSKDRPAAGSTKETGVLVLQQRIGSSQQPEGAWRQITLQSLRVKTLPDGTLQIPKRRTQLSPCGLLAYRTVGDDKLG